MLNYKIQHELLCKNVQNLESIQNKKLNILNRRRIWTKTRKGSDVRSVFTSFLSGPLLCRLCGSCRDWGVREKGGWGETARTMFTRPQPSFSCATPGLFCSTEATVKPIKKRQVRAQWDNNTNPLPPHQFLRTPKPSATKTRAGGERSEAERGGAAEKRSARFSGSRIQAPWPRAAWMRPSVFSSSAHFHLGLSERTVQMSVGEGWVWMRAKGNNSTGKMEWEGINDHVLIQKNIAQTVPFESLWDLMEFKYLCFIFIYFFNVSGKNNRNKWCHTGRV